MRNFTHRKEELSMTNYEFQSILSTYMNKLIALKKTSGIDVVSISYTLKTFDKYLCEINRQDPHLDSTFFANWQNSLLNDSSGTLHNKYSLWRQLTSLMCRCGCFCYVPQAPKKLKSEFNPYIFTNEQILLIFDCCDNLIQQSHNANSALFAMPALFRLLYSTGMRVSEALRLRNRDINFKNHSILLSQTKNDHERLVPLCESMEDVLTQYLRYREKLNIKEINFPDHLFFIKSNGTALSNFSVGYCLRNILEIVGIPYVGRQQGPRVHDLRHTQAVHALAKMAKEGIDIYTGLVVLSTTLGHLSVASTNSYVRLTQSMYPEIEKRLSAYNEVIYNKISKL